MCAPQLSGKKFEPTRSGIVRLCKWITSFLCGYSRSFDATVRPSTPESHQVACGSFLQVTRSHTGARCVYDRFCMFRKLFVALWCLLMVFAGLLPAPSHAAPSTSYPQASSSTFLLDLWCSFFVPVLETAEASERSDPLAKFAARRVLLNSEPKTDESTCRYTKLHTYIHTYTG